ncbi:hypothetical protein GCM10027418_17390 [Mariniluteicoccus endophyticus]
MPLRRSLASAALVCALAGAPALAYASPTSETAAVTVSTAKPTYQPGEAVELTGAVTDAAGQPVADGLVVVTIDGDHNDPVSVTSDPAGRWSVSVPARSTWLPGRVPVDVAYVAGPDTPGATQASAFTLAGTGTPVTLATNPVAGPVTQGQDVELTGTLRLPDGRPVNGQSVYATLDGSDDAAAFGSTNEQGAWHLRVKIPADAGARSATFPAYEVRVRFDGDSGVSYTPGTPGLAAADAPVALTLAGPPVTRPTPSSTPTPAAPTPVAQQAVAAVPQGRPSEAGPSKAGPSRASKSAYVAVPSPTSPGVLALGAGMIATVAGAAMISHAMRWRD